MLSPLEQARLVDLVVVCVTLVFGFAIVSTLIAVGGFSFRRNVSSNQSIETARSSEFRKKCIGRAKENGKVAK
jgi:hypothetical protein